MTKINALALINFISRPKFHCHICCIPHLYHAYFSSLIIMMQNLLLSISELETIIMMHDIIMTDNMMHDLSYDRT